MWLLLVGQSVCRLVREVFGMPQLAAGTACCTHSVPGLPMDRRAGIADTMRYTMPGVRPLASVYVHDLSVYWEVQGQ